MWCCIGMLTVHTKHTALCIKLIRLMKQECTQITLCIIPLWQDGRKQDRQKDFTLQINWEGCGRGIKENKSFGVLTTHCDSCVLYLSQLEINLPYKPTLTICFQFLSMHNSSSILYSHSIYPIEFPEIWNAGTHGMTNKCLENSNYTLCISILLSHTFRIKES
jgi:hypothetical protein